MLVAVIPEEEFLLSNFRRYYESSELPMPDRIQAREIGFIPFNGTMVRHYSLQDARYANLFFRQTVPRHLYYSSAYYRKPDDRQMKEKEWLGAELIFDLDADHLQGAERMTYGQILEEVKKHTLRLVDQYLLGDMDFPEENVQVFFSGGRGYHVHVHGEDIYTMSSDMRREIANYCRLEGFGSQQLQKMKGRSVETGTGVYVRFSEYLSIFMNALAKGGIEEREIATGILGEKGLSRFMKGIGVDANGMSQGGRRDQLFSPSGGPGIGLTGTDRTLLDGLLEKFKREQSCEIDEPVTTDVHRLIRFPGSLHGKTGLEVMPVPVGHLNDFDPLVEAVPGIFKSDYLEVNVPAPVQATMLGEQFSLPEGKQQIPLCLAIFLAGQRKVRLE